MKVILLLLSLLFLSSCSKNSEQELTEHLESAQSLINKNKFTDAINILDKVEEKYKKDVRFIDLISSAYAGRAGFSSFVVSDLLEKHKEHPEQAMYELATKYQTSDILDSQKALSYIYSLDKNPDLRPQSLNFKYSTIQVYKISQILLKNISKFNETKSLEGWNPCEEVNLLSLDLRDILISINRAVISAKNIQENLYNQLIQIQVKYNVNPQVFEEEVVEKTDINNIRVSIGESYSEFVGISTISCESSL